MKKGQRKRLAGLRDLADQETLVRVERTRVQTGFHGGFVVGMSDDLLLLHMVDGDTLLLNGYSAVRLKDITAWRVDESFVSRALLLLDRHSAVPAGLDLTDWPSLIASAQRTHPLVMVNTEAEDPDRAWIGRMVRSTARRMVLREVDTAGRWRAEETKYALCDITQVEFGDGYTEALAALVAHETAAPETMTLDG